MRGRSNQQHNNRRNQNPLTRVYESNGPDVKIRGTANHVAEKYLLPTQTLSTIGNAALLRVTAQNTIDQAARFGGLPAKNAAFASAPVNPTSVAVDLTGQPILSGSVTPTASSSLLSTQTYDLPLSNAPTAALPSTLRNAVLPPGTCTGSLCSGSAAFLAKLDPITSAPSLALSTDDGPNLTLRNLGSAPANSLQIAATNFTPTHNCGTTLPPGAECSIALTGTGPGTITIQAANATTQTTDLPATTATANPIAFTPRELDFGVQTATSPATTPNHHHHQPHPAEPDLHLEARRHHPNLLHPRRDHQRLHHRLPHHQTPRPRSNLPHHPRRSPPPQTTAPSQPTGSSAPETSSSPATPSPPPSPPPPPTSNSEPNTPRRQSKAPPLPLPLQQLRLPHLPRSSQPARHLALHPHRPLPHHARAPHRLPAPAQLPVPQLPLLRLDHPRARSGPLRPRHRQDHPPARSQRLHRQPQPRRHPHHPQLPRRHRRHRNLQLTKRHRLQHRNPALHPLPRALRRLHRHHQLPLGPSRRSHLHRRPHLRSIRARNPPGPPLRDRRSRNHPHLRHPQRNRHPHPQLQQRNPRLRQHHRRPALRPVVQDHSTHQPPSPQPPPAPTTPPSSSKTSATATASPPPAASPPTPPAPAPTAGSASSSSPPPPASATPPSPSAPEPPATPTPSPSPATASPSPASNSPR